MKRWSIVAIVVAAIAGCASPPSPPAAAPPPAGIGTEVPASPEPASSSSAKDADASPPPVTTAPAEPSTTPPVAAAEPQPKWLPAPTLQPLDGASVSLSDPHVHSEVKAMRARFRQCYAAALAKSQDIAPAQATFMLSHDASGKVTNVKVECSPFPKDMTDCLAKALVGTELFEGKGHTRMGPGCEPSKPSAPKKK